MYAFKHIPVHITYVFFYKTFATKFITLLEILSLLSKNKMYMYNHMYM